MHDFLPVDLQDATLLGRMDFGDGPTPIGLIRGVLRDLSGVAPTISGLIECVACGAGLNGPVISSISLEDLQPEWKTQRRALLAPIDLQCIKAAGVTFAVSTLERVIEEAARGEPELASDIRSRILAGIGMDISGIKPGSEKAVRLKEKLQAEGLWSQYLEVAIGPDAEVFTKAPVLSAIGWGAAAGIRSDSVWNNSEPEIVLVCDRTGRARGAALGNDINLRDFEGRSALLLGKAKDNNASCVIGPFVRIFDASFGMQDVREAVVSLNVQGSDGFELKESSYMSQISRDPEDLIAQVCGQHHQYPDGFVLFCGTMFAPKQDRSVAGHGFTHHPGDLVRVSSPRLGAIENRIEYCHEAPPWEFGIGSLMQNLSARGLLNRAM